MSRRLAETQGSQALPERNGAEKPLKLSVEFLWQHVGGGRDLLWISRLY
jgi:hypothetical protein